ncbi:MAG: hypothetical protein K0S74_1071 [Chlamydiales bacterium]|jgi:putative sigma-54 modulation protein|nr:hypothetical protein [Chlamydiales bacterium]
MAKDEKLSHNIPGYNLSVIGKHINLTQAIKDYIVGKLDKLDRFSPRTVEALITLEILRFQHQVTIVLQFDHTKITAKAETEDMYASVDVAFNRIERQIIKYRNKIQDHHGEHLSAIDMQVNVFRRPGMDEYMDDINDQIDEENSKALFDKYKPHAIVRQEKRSLPTLTYDDAMVKMELSQDQFLVFRGQEDLGIKVIYRTNDGNYGVIEVGK